ncbi:MAG: hypothetical protein EWM47_07200 [Anaerolineaceae bacterium]|nr:MAG: hypothetical protein EWM47_07200 [Anaerolineaceae bacterium]
MQRYSQEELQKALKVVSSSISRCEKMQPKFREGTPQHSLLRNRIKALEISKCLLVDDNNNIQAYTIDDLEKALAPVISIINKTEKAQSKYEKGSIQYKRFSPSIEAMYIVKSLITDELSKRE